MKNFFQDSYNNIGILLICFNRPKYVKNLINILKKIRPKKIYIALDGPRKNFPDDIEKCEAVKKIIENGINWDCNIKKKYEKKNLGTKIAVYNAIRWFFNNEEMGIILEDDINPDLSFFKFSSELLNRFKNKKEIKMISGNNYLKNENLIDDSYYYSQTPATHGWATWHRTWDEMDINMQLWKNYSFFSLLKNFNFNLTRSHYFYKRFKLSYENQIDSWDYQFFFSIIRNNGIIIKPKKNLCKHIGWGEDSTRGKGPDTFPDIKAEKLFFPLSHPKKIKINHKLDKMEDYRVRKLQFIKYFYYLIKKKIFS